MSRPRCELLTVIVGLLLALLVGRAAAQDGAESAEPPDAASSAASNAPPTAGDESEKLPHVPPPASGMFGRIQYVGPDTYILLDAEGRPQPVPGMTYEDFMAAWKKSHETTAPNRRPRFTIESIHIDGQSLEHRAELRFEATIRVLTDESVDVPLGLVGAILQGQPRFGPVQSDAVEETIVNDRGPSLDKPQVEYLSYDPNHGGFVARLAGRAGQRHRLLLHLVVPLLRDGSETTLPLNCARAVSSKLALTVESGVTDASVTSGTLLAQQQLDGGGTQLDVAGIAGPFRLTWQTGDAEIEKFATVLNAVGAIGVSIDGRSIRSDARLTVRSYGGSFDRFRVRLPIGAHLVRDLPADTAPQERSYRISIEEKSDRKSIAPLPDGPHQVVLVELPEKQQGPVVVKLSTEQPIGPNGGGLAAVLAGFEVLGAVRQFGDIGLDVANDWQARWDIGPDVRQVDPSELEPLLQHADLTAAFQYDRQPWSLGVRLATRPLRVHVIPKYELECLLDEARLTVHLAYQVFGARAFEFRVRMEGWELTGNPVESGGLVDQDRMLLTPDGTFGLPLAQGASPRAEITISVRRPISPDATRIQLPLPVPLADSVGTGELIVRAEPNIDLRPDLVGSTGLSPTPMTEALDATSGDNGAELHFRSLLPEAVFVADRVSRTREVSAQVAAKIDIADSVARIDQQVDYVVRYEPIKELVFDVPSEMALNQNGIEIAMLSGAASNEANRDAPVTPLSFAPAGEENGSATSGGRRQLRVALPQPRIGQFAVRIRYDVQQPQGDSVDGAWQVPLTQPAEASTNIQHAIVHAPRRLTVALDATMDDSSWKPAETPSQATNSGSSHEFVADGLQTVLPLIVGEVDFNRPSATIVERVWLQTWLSGDVRQDRAAFRVRAPGSRATIELPPQTLPGEIEVLVDGRPADVLTREAGRIAVRLAPSEADVEKQASLDAAHTVELRFRRAYTQALVTRHRLTPPQIVGTAALSELYWQIVLPGDQHVIQSPAQMTSAGQWQWLGSFWGRRPLQSQAVLEEWVGASTQLAPTSTQNEYLFTGLMPASSIELVTAPRWLIVLVASSVVLALALIWIYVPVAQRAWIVLVLACSVAGLAVAYPATALLIAQASALGVVLAMLSVLIARLLARPARWPVILTTGSSQRQLTPRPESIVMPPVAAAASTAPTATFHVPDSER